MKRRNPYKKLYKPPSKRQITSASLAAALAVPYWARPSGEWKYSDTAIADANAWSTTPVFHLLNGIQPGTSASQRIGMKISIRSIEMRLAATVGANDVTQMNRWLFVLDRQPNGAAIGALTDVLTTGDYLGIRNLANRKRFKILMDKTASLTEQSIAGTANKFWKVYMKFKKPIITEYNGGVAGTIGDIATNSLYMVTVGNIALAATCTGAYGTARIRYTDV